MITIYKYELDLGSNAVAIPHGAQILRAEGQRGKVQLWALVNTEYLTEMRHFNVYGTGQTLPEGVRNQHYKGSAFVDQFVWHVFEDRP